MNCQHIQVNWLSGNGPLFPPLMSLHVYMPLKREFDTHLYPHHVLLTSRSVYLKKKQNSHNLQPPRFSGQVARYAETGEGFGFQNCALLHTNTRAATGLCV